MDADVVDQELSELSQLDFALKVAFFLYLPG